MRKKDLFYYMIENNKEKYDEIICELEKKIIVNEEITDEHLIFLKDFYMKLLFRISVMEFKGYSDFEIAKLLNLNKSIEIFNIKKIYQIKKEYINILDIFSNMLEETYKNVTINEKIL